MVLPAERKCARVLGDRSLEVWHRGKPVATRDAVDLAIPRSAAEGVVKPLDGRARQPGLVAAQDIHHLPFESAIVTPAVEHCRAGGRTELTVKTPQQLVDRVSSIRKVKKVAKDLAASAVNRNRVAEHAPRHLPGLGAVMENTGIPVPVGGEKVTAHSLDEFRGRNDRPVILVDGVERETLSTHDL